MKKFVFLISLISLTSQAAVYLEPKVGVGSSGLSFSDGTTSSTSAGLGNFNAGTIFGASREDLYFGVDFRYDTIANYDGNDNSLNFISAGLGLGYTFKYVPIRWTFTLDLQQRAWTSDFNSMVESGGWRTGFGYFLAKNILINFEYSEPYYSNEDSGAKFLPRIYAFNLSFPMEFDAPSEPWKERRGYKKKQDINTDDFGATEAAAEMEQKFSTAPTNSSSTENEFNDVQEVPNADTAAQSAVEDEFEIEDSPETAEVAPESVEASSEVNSDNESGASEEEDDFNLDDSF